MRYVDGLSLKVLLFWYVSLTPSLSIASAFFGPAAPCVAATTPGESPPPFVLVVAGLRDRLELPGEPHLVIYNEAHVASHESFPAAHGVCHSPPRAFVKAREDDEERIPIDRVRPEQVDPEVLDPDDLVLRAESEEPVRPRVGFEAVAYDEGVQLDLCVFGFLCAFYIKVACQGLR